MNAIYKTKSQVRAETNEQLTKFLKSGGTITVVKPRKAPKQLMSGKTTRSASTGTSGFATGFPSKTFG